jgi:phosphate starvation-inducible protein PhoH
MIVQGDLTQCDKFKTNGEGNYEKSGFWDMWHRTKGIKGVNHMAFDVDDCIRHPLVKRILKTYQTDMNIKLNHK